MGRTFRLLVRHFPELLILTLLLAPLGLAADVAKQHYKLGQDAEKRGASLEAYSRYVQARAADPSSRKYLRAATRLRAATAQAIAIQSTSGLLEVESEDHAPRLETTEFFDHASSLKEALGAHVHEKLIETKLSEIDKFRLHVSPFDLQEHLRL